MIVGSGHQASLDPHRELGPGHAPSGRTDHVRDQERPAHLVDDQLPKCQEPDGVGKNRGDNMVPNVVAIPGPADDRETDALHKRQQHDVHPVEHRALLGTHRACKNVKNARALYTTGVPCQALGSQMVPPRGIEPLLRDPESRVLSVERGRRHLLLNGSNVRVRLTGVCLDINTAAHSFGHTVHPIPLRLKYQIRSRGKFY